MDFFITRPIFASAIALIIILAGGVSMLTLPIAQFPPIVPPQVLVTASYIGAGADVVEKSVTTPIEEQLNGAEGMIYMSSNSTNNGDSNITVTFDAGYDQNIAQMELLSRSNQALPSLPSDVQKVGVTVEKASSSILLGVTLISPNGTYDGPFLQNYAEIHIVDPLARIPGVATILNFGLSEYAMRIWLDPDKLANLGMTATDVAAAISEQNQQAATGAIGLAPAPADQTFSYQLTALGRLDQVEQFEDIVLRALPNGTVVRIKDVARVELGAEEYNWSTTMSNKAAGNVVVFQLAAANGLDIANEVEATMTRLAKHFPEDMEWLIIYDTTMFVRASIREVVTTMLMAVGLVLLVIFIFLQNVRSTLIPTIAVPVSLIGTFAAMAAFGFTINTLSLLGLVVAVALVVDDAIVVVENVNRRLDEGGTDLKEVTRLAMADVRGPIVATTLVLVAVFVPVAFIPGLTGQLYNQFALTIAFAVALSGFNSLTLSPALCGAFLRPRSAGKRKNVAFRIFDTGFEKLTAGYVASVKICARVWYLMLIAFAGLCALAAYLFLTIPQGFVPNEDQGYLISVVELPDAATIARTEAVVTQINDAALSTPGVWATIAVAGYNVIDAIQQPNTGIVFVVLHPWDQRTTAETSAPAIKATLQKKYDQIKEAVVIAADAPPIHGLSATGGFNFELQDLNDVGMDALAEATRNLVAQANARPELSNVYTTLNSDVPQRFLDIDRVKAMTRGVSVTDIFNTLQINLGSLYINEFNKFGRVYRVYLQAEQDARDDEADVGRLQVRNKDGQMIYLNAFLTITPTVGPYSVQHYDMYPSASINGDPAPGYSSGQAVAAMEEVAANLPDGFGYLWTDVVYQQQRAGDLAPLIFGISLLVVFLVLAALYESWVMPVIILMAIPLGLLGAVGALSLRGMDLDVYGQIGLVMLIGLVAKNSILIVEFARDERSRGAGILEAAMTAARIRLRPILMTAMAFVVGLLPLVFAGGAGANARRSLGTVVVGGLFLATVLIIMIPVFYYVIERLRERRKSKSAAPGAVPPPGAEQPAE